ncbi:hypothetical protein [Nostoc sp. PCC 9305]|uniref:hypothetical protein n=1 Tax=Nostoc sp. PCC 9305 TaxID=296636 RepID=UPI0039C5AB34
MSNNTVTPIQYSDQIPKTTKTLSNCVENLGLAKIQRHIFICADQTIAAQNELVWNSGIT